MSPLAVADQIVAEAEKFNIFAAKASCAKDVDGPGVTHNSLENIMMLENFCRANNIKLIHQFYMDQPYLDILKNRGHQNVRYLYNQFKNAKVITQGMYDYLKKFDTESYFIDDKFHPSLEGSGVWCDNILYPFLESQGIRLE